MHESIAQISAKEKKNHREQQQQRRRRLNVNSEISRLSCKRPEEKHHPKVFLLWTVGVSIHPVK